MGPRRCEHRKITPLRTRQNKLASWSTSVRRPRPRLRCQSRRCLKLSRQACLGDISRRIALVVGQQAGCNADRFQPSSVASTALPKRCQAIPGHLVRTGSNRKPLDTYPGGPSSNTRPRLVNSRHAHVKGAFVSTADQQFTLEILSIMHEKPDWRPQWLVQHS